MSLVLSKVQNTFLSSGYSICILQQFNLFLCILSKFVLHVKSVLQWDLRQQQSFFFFARATIDTQFTFKVPIFIKR